jgi:hypothetical protein
MKKPYSQTHIQQHSYKSILKRYNERLEETSSSEEPTSSEEQINPSLIDIEASKILWVSNTSWYTWTDKIGYPRPQGNIPMLLSLTPQKQDSLLRSYFSIYGNSVDHTNSEWKPNDGTL